LTQVASEFGGNKHRRSRLTIIALIILAGLGVFFLVPFVPTRTTTLYLAAAHDGCLYGSSTMQFGNMGPYVTISASPFFVLTSRGIVYISGIGAIWMITHPGPFPRCGLG
jgi:hypothetical protein